MFVSFLLIVFEVITSFSTWDVPQQLKRAPKSHFVTPNTAAERKLSVVSKVSPLGSIHGLHGNWTLCFPWMMVAPTPSITAVGFSSEVSHGFRTGLLCRQTYCFINLHKKKLHTAWTSNWSQMLLWKWTKKPHQQFLTYMLHTYQQIQETGNLNRNWLSLITPLVSSKPYFTHGWRDFFFFLYFYDSCQTS